MSINYDKLFSNFGMYAGMGRIGRDFKTKLDVILLHHSTMLSREVDDSELLRDIIDLDLNFKNEIDTQVAGYVALLENYLLSEGRDDAHSSSQTATAVIADIILNMTRDGESVAQNTVGNSVVYDRAGYGAMITLTQTQMTRNDTITLTVTQQQTGSQNALFSVRSQIEGNLLGVVVTADGVQSFDDTSFGKNLGIAALVIGVGNVGNEWELSDQIIITTSTDDASILLSFVRDEFNKELPSSTTPTIKNLMQNH